MKTERQEVNLGDFSQPLWSSGTVNRARLVFPWMGGAKPGQREWA